MTYQFIVDEVEVRKFYKHHLSKYADSKYLSFIIIPIARRKYWDKLSVSQFTVNTKLQSTREDEDNFVQEIRKYEVKEGLYNDNGVPIPRDAFGFYITANPMNELKGYFLFQKEINGYIEQMVSRNEVPHFKMMSVYKSCLHKCPENDYVKLDVDTKDYEHIDELKQLFKKHGIVPHLVIESRGGYHVVLEKKKLGKEHKTLYDFCTANETWVTVEKNPLLVIPGTAQGGFVPRIIEKFI
jgi:hypothetical protein